MTSLFDVYSSSSLFVWLVYLIFVFITIIVIAIWMNNQRTKKICTSCIVSNLDETIPSVILGPECYLDGVSFFSEILLGAANDANGTYNFSRYVSVLDSTGPDPPFQPAFIFNEIRSITFDSDGSLIFGLTGTYNGDVPALATPQNLIPGDKYSAIYRYTDHRLSIDKNFGAPQSVLPAYPSLPDPILPTVGYTLVNDPDTGFGFPNWEVVKVIHSNDDKILVLFQDNSNNIFLARFLKNARNTIDPSIGMDLEFNSSDTPGYIEINGLDYKAVSIYHTKNNIIVVVIAVNNNSTFIITTFDNDGDTYLNVILTAFTETSNTVTVSTPTDMVGYENDIYISGTGILSSIPGIHNPATASFNISDTGVITINPDYTVDQFIATSATENFITPKIVRQNDGKLVVNTYQDNQTVLQFFGLLNNGETNVDFGNLGVVLHDVNSTSIKLISNTLSVSLSDGLLASGAIEATSGVIDLNHYYIVGYDKNGKKLLNFQTGWNPQGVEFQLPSISTDATGQYISNIFSAAYRDEKYIVVGSINMNNYLYDINDPLVTSQGLAMTFGCK